MTVALVGPLLSIAPGIASVAVKIVKIQYDSPGTVDSSNATLNNEYVVIKNAGNGAVRLDDRVLKDKAGHKYTFGSFRLRGGKSAKIHTGSGNDDRNDLYWGSGAYIWNNDGDKAALKDDSGDTVDTCKYAGGGRYVDSLPGSDALHPRPGARGEAPGAPVAVRRRRAGLR